MSKPDPYTVLGLKKGATIQQINDAYHKLAMSEHPDKNLGDTETATANFQKINAAREELLKSLEPGIKTPSKAAPAPAPAPASPPEAAPAPPPPRPPPRTSITDAECINLFDRLCLEMATGASTPETTFESDLKRLTDYFIACIITLYQIDPNNIENIFSDFFDVIKDKLINSVGDFKTRPFFNRINDTSYYTFHNPQKIRLVRLWYDGARLIINNAIKIIKDNPDDYTPEKTDDIRRSMLNQELKKHFFGGASKKRRPLRRKSGTKHPLRRKSATKRIRRRRSNRRTSRK